MQKKNIFISLITITAFTVICFIFNIDKYIQLSGINSVTKILPSSVRHISPSDSCHFPPTGNGRNITDGQWYNFSTPIVRFYAYSAFLYDPDPSSSFKPVIRITAVTSIHVQTDKVFFGENKNNWDISKMYKLVCIFYFENDTKIVKVNDKWFDIGFGYMENGRIARERIYTCELDSKDAPPPVAVKILPADNVTWVADADNHNSRTTCMPIEIPKKPSKKNDFCVCGPASYDHVDPLAVIEWIEMQKILGISLVVVYDINLSEMTRKVLNQYVLEGYLELRKTDSFDSTEIKHYLLHSTPAINDCMYRYMHTCNYIVVVDFDEIIIPILRNHTTLRNLFDALVASRNKTDSPLPPASYAFRNNYIFTDLSPDVNESNVSTYLRYRQSVETSPQGYSTKSIHDPRACSHVHNHYCWGKNAAFKSRPVCQEVEAEYALNFHYKKCHFSLEECKRVMKNVSQVDAMLKYKYPLLLNIARRLERFQNNTNNHTNEER